MPDNCQDIIAALDRKIEDATNALGAAKQAALDIPALTADLSRLEAARKALAAPQTPKGRRKIGDAQRGRKRGTAPEAPKVAVPLHQGPGGVAVGVTCSQCHRPFDAGDSQHSCPVDGCEAIVHAAGCIAAHRVRWHKEPAK